VAEEFDIKLETCRRYYQTWKKMPPDFERVVRDVSKVVHHPGDKSQFADEASQALGISPEEVQQILLRPWGLRSILLASCGLFHIEPAPTEKEKAALLRMRSDIIRSGMTVEQALSSYEAKAMLDEKITEAAKKLFDPEKLSESQMAAIKRIVDEAKGNRRKPGSPGA